MTPNPDAAELETAINVALDEFTARQRRRLAGLGPDVDAFFEVAAATVNGGKRLRPLFCVGGWLAGGGEPDDPAIVASAAALEWLQASALVHDDLIDGSDTRRGRPAAHRQFEAIHARERWTSDPRAFGSGAAILLGDMLLAWCDDMLRSSQHDAEALHRAGRYLDLCKSEVAGGQYLDLVGQARGENSEDAALRVVRYKSAAYTVDRPLHLGAALAGGDASLFERLSAFGLPVGTAFQLRDDLLGVFGDPAVTGKPAGDDLREGKRTVLVARAAAAASPAERSVLEASLGAAGLDAAGVDTVRAIIDSTGARASVERRIADLEAEAEAALAALERPEARSYLGALLARLAGRER